MYRLRLMTLAVFSLGFTPALAALFAQADRPAPFFEMQQIYEGQRFPNVAVALDGTVIAFRGQNGPIQARRSEDGGDTWGPIIQIGESVGLLGAAIVDENTGDIMVFQHFILPGGPMYRSRDHGKTWIEEEHVIQPDGFGGIGTTSGAESGITLQYGEHKGRLLMPARVFGPENSNELEWRPYCYNSAIYSDDGGKTWQTSAPFPILGTGEGAIAELSDGRLYYNSRKHMPARVDDNKRRVAWSYDGGESWRDACVCEFLPDGPLGSSYGCMGGLVRVPVDNEDILIYSNLDEPTSARQNITVWASLDGGETWPIKRLVYNGPGAYSSLAAGRDGTRSEGFFYLLFEGGPEGMYSAFQLARFNLAWLLDGG